MTRPATARTAACLAAVLLTALTAGLLPLSGPVTAAAAAAPAVDQAPLQVTIDTMTPSTVPRRGTVTLSGEVTNTSDQTWTDLQAYLFVGKQPLTTPEELATAASTDPAAEVGSRIYTPGLYQDIGNLAPGQTTSYTLSVPRGKLGISGAPGVYWIGVHVLGAVDGVRDGIADGRARSFIPLMTRQGPSTQVAVVVPVRDRVRRASDGRLLEIGRWQQSFGPDGRLGRLLGLVRQSQGPLTLLMDPAVLDAARSVAGGNQPFSTAPDGSGPDQGGEPGSSPSASPSASPGDGGDGGTGNADGSTGGDVPADAGPEAQAASTWLTDMVARAASATVLALPYGDLDVAAAAAGRLFGLVKQADGLSSRTMTTYGVDSTPVVAPPTGVLSSKALARLDRQTPVVLSDRAFPDEQAALVHRPDGTRVVLLDSAAGSGGPGPNEPTDPLALRQRILAEAAVNALTTDGTRPLVVSTPEYWALPARWRSADFFGGLDVPWLTQVDLNGLLAGDHSASSTQPPAYPARDRRRQVPFANQLATQDLLRTGRLYADLLTDNNNIADQLGKAGMLASSYGARGRPLVALDRARATDIRARRTMQLVHIDAPGFVMMSSQTGPISVTVVNNLDEPVTVRLRASSPGSDLKITTPAARTLGPGQRAPVRMRAESHAIGVRTVTVEAVTEDGRPLGSEVAFTVRTSNVGLVIWLVMGAGGALLLVMIVFRIVRRVRA